MSKKDENKYLWAVARMYKVDKYKPEHVNLRVMCPFCKDTLKGIASIDKNKLCYKCFTGCGKYADKLDWERKGYRIYIYKFRSLREILRRKREGLPL